jgi:cobalt-zinc-cadmium resistance protein CzcA
MLNGLINWSLQHRFLVLALSVVLAGIGLYSVSILNIDAFPDTTPVQVQVNAIAPGLTPEEVESQITAPVEQALGGLPALSQVRSVSKFGLSQVVVTFVDGTDVYFARQQVNERLAAAALPQGVPRPSLGPIATGLGEVFHYLVSGGGADPTELRTVQDWMIRPALRTVPGTAEINGWGGHEKQYQVLIEPERLLRYGITFEQVVGALEANNLNVGGGALNIGGQMLLIHGSGRTGTVAQIRAVPIIAREGVPVRVGDVADVRIGSALRMGGVTHDGRGEAVLGLGFLLMNENGHQVTRHLQEKLGQIRENLPQGVQAKPVYERTELVDQVIQTVRSNLFEGGLLVIAVLFVFLGNLRAGLVVALAIPLSLLFAFSGMLRFSIAASLLSLGALDFGLVVDSAVVMVENVMRHTGDKAAELQRRIDLVRNAILEVRQPTLFGELIIMIVYLPILSLEGVEGKLFRPMALTVIFALLGSLMLSLTVIPVLASLLLPRRVEDRDPLVVRLARSLYLPVLRTALNHRLAIILLAVAAQVLAIAAARTLGSEFIPRLSEGALVVNIFRLPGTSVEESLRYNTLMERRLLAAFPDEVEHVWSRCGTGEVATDPMGPEETDMFITLRPRGRWQRAQTQDELVGQMSSLLADYPGQRLSFTQPIEQRVNEMISGVRSEVAIKLFGDDFAVLDKKAGELRNILESVDGHADVGVEQLTGQPTLQIRVKQEEIARHGISARSVLELVASLGGKPVGEVLEGQLRFPMAVWLPDSMRKSPEAVGRLLLTASSGARLPLSRLADIAIGEGPSKIMRESGQRRIVVQCNVRGRDLGGFVAEAQQRVAREFQLPPGRYRLEWGGQFENLERARLRLEIVVPLALALIFALLYLTYSRIPDVVLIFSGVPFACVGGVLALYFRGLPFSISAGVGFIALSGVSVLNSMVLVTFLRHLLEQGIDLDRAVEEAAMTRLRPVLMTALVASLGFVPMALSTGVGAEVQRPLATVVIGGVISSTLLTLLVLPVLYDIVESWMHRMHMRRRALSTEPPPSFQTVAAAASGIGGHHVLMQGPGTMKPGHDGHQDPAGNRMEQAHVGHGGNAANEERTA